MQAPLVQYFISHFTQNKIYLPFSPFIPYWRWISSSQRNSVSFIFSEITSNIPSHLPNKNGKQQKKKHALKCDLVSFTILVHTIWICRTQSNERLGNSLFGLLCHIHSFSLLFPSDTCNAAHNNCASMRKSIERMYCVCILYEAQSEHGEHRQYTYNNHQTQNLLFCTGEENERPG